MSFRSIILLIIINLSSLLVAKAQIGQMRQVGPPGSGGNSGQLNVNQSDTSYVPRGPAKEPYTLKRYFKSLAGKDSMSISRMWAGSFILPGSAQLYNKEYWKIPIVYGSIGTFAYVGYQNNLEWHKTGDSKYRTYRDLCYLGAALSYWGSVMDGVHSYKYHKKVLPARASLYSAMLPGLGQMYNGDYWKIPIFYGGFVVTGYFISSNHSQYKRYRDLYNQVSLPDSDLKGKYNPETMKYYRDTYRRFRDYSILSGILIYALNIIDANVFAHMQDFDVSEDLSASLSPGITMPLNFNYANNMGPIVGFNLKINF